MGLSDSKSKTDTSQTQNTNQVESGTTTPITPDFLTQAATDYVGRIGSFGQQDPNSFVAGAAPLQNAAWNNASSLGDWRQQAATAAGMAQQAGMGGASLAGPGGAMGRYAGGMGLTPSPQMYGGGGAQMPASALGGSAQTAQSALGGDQMMPAGIKGPAHSTNLAPPPSSAFSGASSQQPTGLVSGAGYTMPPAQPGYAQPRSGYPIGGAPAYQATATGYDAPQLNTPGNVSGQTYNPAQIAQTPGATASNADSASLLTNLSQYQDPYTTQVRDAALSDFDRQSAQQQARLEAQGAAAGAFGGSRFGVAQGQMLGDQDRARATLDAGLLDQGFNTAAQLSQSDAANQQQANLFNAQNQTGVSQFNSGQDATRALAQAGYNDTAARYGADSSMQAALANQGMQGQFGLAQGQLDANAGQWNAGNQTAVSGQNATANNNMSQFNASQQDAAQNRQLQAAGMIGGLANDYGTGTRADLGTMAQLGDQQRQIEQAYNMSGPAQLQLMGQLSGMTPYDILVGRQVNGNTTGTMQGTGTSTTSQTPSLFSQLMQGGQLAAAFM